MTQRDSIGRTITPRQAYEINQAPPPPGEWINQAACAQLSPLQSDQLFFPLSPAGDRGRTAAMMTRKAQRICRECPVQHSCGEYALRYRIAHGIWGGMTEAQREHILRHGGLGAP